MSLAVRQVDGNSGVIPLTNPLDDNATTAAVATAVNKLGSLDPMKYSATKPIGQVTVGDALVTIREVFGQGGNVSASMFIEDPSPKELSEMAAFRRHCMELGMTLPDRLETMETLVFENVPCSDFNIPYLRNLTSLTFKNLPNFTGDELTKLSGIRINTRNKLPSLQELTIINCPKFGYDNGWADFVGECIKTRLEAITLIELPGVSANDFVQLKKAFFFLGLDGKKLKGVTFRDRRMDGLGRRTIPEQDPYNPCVQLRNASQDFASAVYNQDVEKREKQRQASRLKPV
jgi:hypothetical protein